MDGSFDDLCQLWDVEQPEPRAGVRPEFMLQQTPPGRIHLPGSAAHPPVGGGCLRTEVQANRDPQGLRESPKPIQAPYLQSRLSDSAHQHRFV